MAGFSLGKGLNWAAKICPCRPSAVFCAVPGGIGIALQSGMENQTKILYVPKAKNFSFHEDGLMALLFVLGIVQIAGMFSASGSMLKPNTPTAAIVQLQDGPLLSKK